MTFDLVSLVILFVESHRSNRSHEVKGLFIAKPSSKTDGPTAPPDPGTRISSTQTPNRASLGPNKQRKSCRLCTALLL